MLQVLDLSCSYGKREVFRELAFEVAPGELCGLFGPNGCGKTTLFKCCLSFLRFRGRVLVDGIDTRSLGAKRLARMIAYVPQEHHPPFPYSVLEIVLMGRTAHMASGIFGIPGKDRARAMDALEMLGIADLAPLQYTRLSGGQRQLALIARALAQDTGVMLLDEPTSSLDFHNQVKVWQVLQRIARRGTTILACTHDPNHVAWFCDRVVLLHDRKIVAAGKPKDVFTESMLNALYRGVCRVADAGGVDVVLPQSHTNRIVGVSCSPQRLECVASSQ